MCGSSDRHLLPVSGLPRASLTFCVMCSKPPPCTRSIQKMILLPILALTLTGEAAAGLCRHGGGRLRQRG